MAKKRRGLPLWARWNNFRYGTMDSIGLSIFRWRQKHRLMTHEGWNGMLMFISNLVMVPVFIMVQTQKWPLLCMTLALILLGCSYTWSNRAFYQRVKRYYKGKEKNVSAPFYDLKQLFNGYAFRTLGYWGTAWLIGYVFLGLYMAVSGNLSLWLYAYPAVFFLIVLYLLVSLIRRSRAADIPSFEIRGVTIEEDADDE